MSIRPVVLLLPALLMAAGCSLVALPDRTVRYVVHPGEGAQAAADRRAGRALRHREERRHRAWVRCRRLGYPDC